MVRLAHASGEAVTIDSEQALGDESPLVFDEDGYAHVNDEEAAKLCAAMHRDIRVEPAADDTDGGTGDNDDFDAAAFADRTPMETVISDIESGEYDGHLDAIEAEASREGVKDAIDARRD